MNPIGTERTEGNSDIVKDIIITMLPKGPHVKGAFTDPETGLLSTLTGNKMFIECTTIYVKTSEEVAKAVADKGLGVFADAPVSGSPDGARAANLTIMVGASDKLFSEMKPILSTMGAPQNIFHCGPPGAGLATKQINNYLSGVAIIGVSEAMNMGIRYGLDPKTLAGVINVSSGYNSLGSKPSERGDPDGCRCQRFSRFLVGAM